jgi:hypothetical protein
MVRGVSIQNGWVILVSFLEKLLKPKTAQAYYIQQGFNAGETGSKSPVPTNP